MANDVVAIAALADSLPLTGIYCAVSPTIVPIYALAQAESRLFYFRGWDGAQWVYWTGLTSTSPPAVTTPAAGGSVVNIHLLA